jgi:hypothetical protein
MEGGRGQWETETKRKLVRSIAMKYTCKSDIISSSTHIFLWEICLPKLTSGKWWDWSSTRVLWCQNPSLYSDATSNSGISEHFPRELLWWGLDCHWLASSVMFVFKLALFLCIYSWTVWMT